YKLNVEANCFKFFVNDKMEIQALKSPRPWINNTKQTGHGSHTINRNFNGTHGKNITTRTNFIDNILITDSFSVNARNLDDSVHSRTSTLVGLEDDATNMDVNNGTSKTIVNAGTDKKPLKKRGRPAKK
ncbi:MAG: hypothetical protein ACRC0V_06165, partial [Fusobacteriaceae bacterium]